MKGHLTDAQWNALSPAEKTKLIKKRKAEKAGKTAATGGTAKSSKIGNDACSVSSARTMED